MGGWNTLYLPENDKGPDDAEHDWYGVFPAHDPEETLNKEFKQYGTWLERAFALISQSDAPLPLRAATHFLISLLDPLQALHASIRIEPLKTT